MLKWKVYISSTFKDLKELRAELISLFQNQLNNKFELSKIMERMFDDGSYIPFVEECILEVTNCDIYLIILGNKTGSFPPNESRTYTEIELDTAIEQKKKIFFLRLHDFDENEIDYKSKHNQLLDKFIGRSVHSFKDIITLENSIFKCLYPYTSQSPIILDNPYKGLAAFDVGDGDKFFGRSHEIEECIKKIITCNENVFISIVGNSGIGKTSFVQAGVLYRLKNDAECGFSDYQQIIVTPGSEPFTNLKYQLQKNKTSIDHSNDETFLNKTILFFNQFEEVITQCHTRESIKEREQLFDFLSTLTSRKKSKSRFIVITTFRSDFLSQLVNFDFIKLHQINFFLRSLDYKIHSQKWEESIKEIIEQPAIDNGVIIEPELVNTLINEIKDVEGSLPILQFILSQIWNHETIKDRRISSTEYIKLSDGKGVSGIIEVHARNVVNRITENGNHKDKEAILKSIFVNLIEVNENSLDIKKTVKKEELLNKLKVYSAEVVTEIFEDLVSENSRLLVVSETKGKSINVDIIHEVLIRKWEQLRIWINERRSALEYQKRITTEINDFNNREGKLLSEKKLKNALIWKTKNPDLTNHAIERFIKNSKREVNRKKAIFIATPLIILLLSFIIYTPYKQWKFIEEVEKNPSLKEQVEAAGGHINSIKTLVLDANNYFTVSGKIPYFKNLDTLTIIETPLNDLSILKGLTSLKLLKIFSNDNLTSLKGVENLSSINSLEISYNNSLASLEGIENLKSLASLELDKNDGLKNLQSIQKLISLKYLSISSMKLINLPELNKLTSLRSINLVGIDGLSNLEWLPAQLESLSLWTLDLKNLQGIEKMTRLTSLRISNIENLTSLQGIENLPSLKYLEISNLLVPSLQSIYGSTSLDSLEISRIPILKNLRVLERLSSLKYLDLSSNDSLTGLDGIKNLTSLISLRIANTSNFFTLNGIENLSSLKNLSFYNMNIGNLQSLKGLNGLTSLSIYRSDLNSLQGIESLTSLKSLSISDTRTLNSIQGIEKLFSLESLTIDQIGDLNSLEGIEKLTSLNNLRFLPNDSLTNLTGLEKLKALKHLEISHINQNFLQELRALDSLQQLIISGTSLTSLREIGKLTSLNSLSIYGIRDLSNLEGIESLNLLRHLIIDGNYSLVNLLGLEKLTALKILEIGRNSKELDLDMLYKLKKIEKLTIWQTYNVDYNLLKKNNPTISLIKRE